MGVLCLFLAIACIFDYLRHRVPNELVVILFLTGIGLRLTEGSLLEAFLFPPAAVSIMILLYPLYKIGCIGAGDVKLLGICAGYLPFQKIFSFLFVSLLITAIFSLIKLIVKHHTKERFYYLAGYMTQVLRSGKWHLYFEDKKMQKSAGICLSGPIFLSVILYMGGFY